MFSDCFMKKATKDSKSLPPVPESPLVAFEFIIQPHYPLFETIRIVLSNKLTERTRPLILEYVRRHARRDQKLMLCMMHHENPRLLFQQTTLLSVAIRNVTVPLDFVLEMHAMGSRLESRDYQALSKLPESDVVRCRLLELERQLLNG